jgi:phage tail sheath protein FI
LAGGDSGTAPTNGAIGLAMEAEFGDPEKTSVNIFINGGIYDVAYQQKLESIARTRGDAVAILDAPPQAQQFQDYIDYRNLTLNINSSYAALYGPDIFSDDPYNGKKLYVPPSGYVASVYARTDAVAGPQFAPAGLNRGLLNVLGLREEYNEAQRTLLFQAQCNYVRKFIGEGIAVFEAVTLQAKQSALSWVNVRRMINVIKVSVKDFLMFSLHEPNDDFTRRQIVQSISEFLQFWKDARGILEFKVISDNTNNPSAQYNLGILKVTIFVTPVIPVHEIMVDMVITKQGISFSEVSIQNLG